MIAVPDEGEPKTRIRMDVALRGKVLLWTFLPDDEAGRALLHALVEGPERTFKADEAKKLAARLRGLGVDLTDKLQR